MREVAFAPEPVLHGFLELVERHSRSDLHASVGDGQGVVENRGVGEVPHGKVVQPLEGAGVALAVGLVVDLELAEEHGGFG